MIRTTALLVVLSLSAPSMAALICDWSCASRHSAETGSTSAGCHEQHADAVQGPAITAGPVCHELPELPATIVRVARQIDSGPAVAPVLVARLTLIATRSHFESRVASRPPDPVLLAIPLRI